MCFDLTIAILIGVVAALVLLAVRQSHLEIHFDDVKPQRLQHPEDLVADRFENAEVVYLTGAVLFANCEQITDLAGRFQGRSAVLFSMRGVSYMDVSGTQAFLELLRQLKEQELPVYICGLSDSVPADDGAQRHCGAAGRGSFLLECGAGAARVKNWQHDPAASCKS